MPFEKKKQVGYSDNEFAIIYESEVIDGQTLDTEVKIDDSDTWVRICFIAGQDIENFNAEFKSLIEKYRI